MFPSNEVLQEYIDFCHWVGLGASLPAVVACVYLPLLAEQRDGEEEPTAVFGINRCPLRAITGPIESQMWSRFPPNDRSY